jgi:hypothetical protein
LSVTISRFVQVLSGGKVVSNSVVKNLDAKLTARINQISKDIEAFESKPRNPKARELTAQLASLQDIQASALMESDNNARSELLEKGNTLAKMVAEAAGELDKNPAKSTATMLSYDLNWLERTNAEIPDRFIQETAVKKLSDLKRRRGELAAKGDPADEARTLLGDVESAINWTDLAIQFGTGGRKHQRIEVRSGAALYLREGKKLSKDPEKKQQGAQLVDYAQKLREQLKNIERIAKQDPESALFELRNLYGLQSSAGDLYKSAVLAPELLEKVKKLIVGDPKGAEAALQAVLGPKEFEERLLTVYNNARAAGCPDIELLAPGDAVAILNYTTQDYKAMNALLLTGAIDGDDAAKQSAQVKIERAINALAKLPACPASPSQRGEKRWQPLDGAQYTRGNEFAIKTFWSTGIGYNFNGYWNITVFGKSGKNIAPLSIIPGECEVLFTPGTRFRVKSVNRGNVVVEEI